MATSTISRRTDEDLLNRSLLDSIEAEALSERVEPPHPSRDVSSPVSFSYPLSPQSPQSINHFQFSDMFANTSHDDFHQRPLPLGRAPAPSYSTFTLEHQPTRSATLPPPQMCRDQRFQTSVDTFNLPRQFDQRADARDYIKQSQYPPPLYHPVAPHPSANIHHHHHTHRDEEISTIFVVGFPDDMQEREFQNMFIFSKGFEAASLKIPQKEPATPHNSISPYPQDQPGHVSSTQWNPTHEDGFGTQASNPAPPPRKQIIGFAKFKTRSEALEARDMLQGKKVDGERGSILKAEMAKKNLHTKRGPGPSGLPLSMVTPGNMVGIETLATLAGLPGGVAALPTLSSGEAMRDREKELGTLGAMGFIGSGIHRRDREVSNGEKKRDLASGSIQRSRFTSSESEAEVESSRYLRSHNEVAFDAFHAVPAQPYRTPASLGRSVLSPTDSFSSLSPGQEQANFPPSLTSAIAPPSVAPWANFGQNTGSSTNGSSPQSDISAFPPSLSAFSLTDSPPMAKLAPRDKPDPDKTMIADLPRESRYQFGRPTSHPPSSASSVTGSHSSVDGDTDGPINGSVASLQPDPSPPFSATSFPTGKSNPSDQNPPINTLYVGNLPNAVPSPGYNLEESLRHLFSQRPGYRKLVYKYKNGTPMCFVEFEDVSHATQALSELYGNQLNGLVKSGIRLSYSKNPLGVRPSATQSSAMGIRNSPWGTDIASPISPSINNTRSTEQSTSSQQAVGLRHLEYPEQGQRTFRASAMSPTYNHPNSYHYFTSDTQSDNSTPQTLAGSASMFSPFQNLGAMTFTRETKIPPLTPSPGIEVARAG